MILWLAAGAVGCQAASYRPDVSGFYHGNPQATYDALAAEGKRGIAERNEALWRSELASAAMGAGDESSALKSLQAAGRLMGTLDSTPHQRARAIFSAEATKIYRGDPYERCMNALYQGILYYRAGDKGRANAAFRRGLLADGWSAEGEHQRDFAALSFLSGWASYQRGQPQRAKFAFKEARTWAPDNPYFQSPDPKHNNVLIVAGVGLGPEKYPDGAYGEVVRFRRRPHADHGIRIRVDGSPAGYQSAMATDLYMQAITRGKRVLDGIRKGKAIFKGATEAAGKVLIYDAALTGRHTTEKLAAGLALLLLSALTSAEADHRHWSLLPGEIHILYMNLPPGPHRLTVEATDVAGKSIPGWSRDFDVDVPASGDTLYYFRTVPEGGIYGIAD